MEENLGKSQWFLGKVKWRNSFLSYNNVISMVITTKEIRNTSFFKDQCRIIGSIPNNHYIKQLVVYCRDQPPEHRIKGSRRSWDQKHSQPTAGIPLIFSDLNFNWNHENLPVFQISQSLIWFLFNLQAHSCNPDLIWSRISEQLWSNPFMMYYDSTRNVNIQYVTITLDCT